MSAEIVPFGKHKGKPVDALLDDRPYLDWLLSQSWFKEKFGNVYNVVINNGQEPSETPDHNAMQIKFLDEEYRLKFAVAALGPEILSLASNDAIGEWVKQVRALKARVIAEAQAYNQEQEQVYARQTEDFQAACAACPDCINGSTTYVMHDHGPRPHKPTPESLTLPETPFCALANGELLLCPDPVFEEQMVDVQYGIKAGFTRRVWSLPTHKYRTGYYGQRRDRIEIDLPESQKSFDFKIEIKPSVGDDYPSVLRQIERYRKHLVAIKNHKDYSRDKPEDLPFFLLVRSYAGIGATREQFEKFFKLKNITVVYESDVDEVELPLFDRKIDAGRFPIVKQ